MKTIRYILLFLILSAGISTVLADEVSFTAQAPKQVVMGKTFQLQYTINRQVKQRDLRAPEFNDFDLLAGPYESQNVSMSFVNGHYSHDVIMTYTYTLTPRRTGEFTIGPATIKADGETQTSNGVRIQVLPADEPQNNGNNANNGNNGNNGTANISSENLFVRTIVSKTRVMEQEALSVTYKLYFAGVDVAQLTNNIKLPEFDGFLKQQIDLGEQQLQIEHYNGRNYQTMALHQFLLYPQHSGDIEITPASYETILRVAARRQVRSFFDDFIGNYANVSKTLVAPGAKIHVEALPAGKPADYCGAVGQLSMLSNISATEVTANEAITLKLTIQGNANLKLLKTPSVDWPEGFEPYDPKVTNNYKTTASGTSGSKVIEYLAIPRAAGTSTIPAIHFSYYDTAEGKYKTLSTPEYTIKVNRGAGAAAAATGEGETSYTNYVNKEDIKQLGTDIRYIYVGEKQTEAKEFAVPAWLIVVLYLLPTLLAILVLIIMRKRISLMANADYMRLRRAKREARTHLKAARRLEGKPEFWESIERTCRACEPYVDVKEVLSRAEYARYAPAIAGSPDDIWNQTAALVEQLNKITL